MATELEQREAQARNRAIRSDINRQRHQAGTQENPSPEGFPELIAVKERLKRLDGDGFADILTLRERIQQLIENVEQADRDLSIMETVLRHLSTIQTVTDAFNEAVQNTKDLKIELPQIIDQLNKLNDVLLDEIRKRDAQRERERQTLDLIDTYINQYL